MFMNPFEDFEPGNNATLPQSSKNMKSSREPTMEDVKELTPFINSFNPFMRWFPYGSVRYGCASDNSDIDIAIPIMFHPDIIVGLSGKGISFEGSSYNKGVKFSQGQLVINFAFLHPLDFVCWFKVARMVSQNKLFENKELTRPLRHAIHEGLSAMVKASFSGVNVNPENYQEFLKAGE